VHKTCRLKFNFKLADIDDSGIRSIERPIGCGGNRPFDGTNTHDGRRRDPSIGGLAKQP